MEEQYGMGDLRQYLTGRPLFPPPDLLSAHRSLTPAQHYEMVLMGRQVSHDMVPPAGLHHEFRPDVATAATSAAGFCGLEMEASGVGAADAGTGRWPRQETLTLLEIRSRLDPKFKEANQKGPLWDEVSRIMSEEHGYQRSGKKCREKFENLYKYYKKTKEGKAGRQDGKHYRFFRQLEALYGGGGGSGGGGETSNIAAENHHTVGTTYRYSSMSNNAAAVSNQELFLQAPKPSSDSLSLSNSSSEFESTSSEEDMSDINATTTATADNHSNEARRRRRSSKREGRKSWKSKIRDFVDSQMRKIMEKQEAWVEKMMRAMEQKEQERALREEEWRKQEAADRIDREHKFWANERAWIEARDATLMETLRKLLTGKEIVKSPPLINQNDIATCSPPSWPGGRKNHINSDTTTTTPIISSCAADCWTELETTRLIQLRTSMDPRFQQQLGCPEQQVLLLWEEIAAKMACLGYHRNALMCKDKWDGISSYLIKCTKKRKENSNSNSNSRMCSNYLANDSMNSQQGGGGGGGGGTSAYSSDTTTTTDQGPAEALRNPQNMDQPSSPPNADTAAPEPSSSSYRFIISDTENMWENYGMKFSKGETR